jgi:chromosome segregation ATPase
MSSIDDYKLATPPEYDEPERDDCETQLQMLSVAYTEEVARVDQLRASLEQVTRERDEAIERAESLDGELDELRTADLRGLVDSLGMNKAERDEYKHFYERALKDYTSCRDALIAQCRLTADETARANAAEARVAQYVEWTDAEAIAAWCEKEARDMRVSAATAPTERERDACIVEADSLDGVAADIRSGAYRTAPGGETGRE